MKRKESFFEKKLIENGWKLHYKKYYGKHREKVLSYIYSKEYEIMGHNVNAFVELRKYDLKILDLGFENVFTNINYGSKMIIESIFDKINGEVREILYHCLYSNVEPIDYEEVEEEVEVMDTIGKSDEN